MHHTARGSACLRSALEGPAGTSQPQTPSPPRSSLRSPPEDDACKDYISENYSLLGGTQGDGSDGTLPSKASGRASEASGKLQLP